MTERGTRPTTSHYGNLPPHPPTYKPASAWAAAPRAQYTSRDEWLNDMLRASAEIASRLSAGARLDVPPSPPPPGEEGRGSFFLTQTGEEGGASRAAARAETRAVDRVVITTEAAAGGGGQQERAGMRSGKGGAGRGAGGVEGASVAGRAALPKLAVSRAALTSGGGSGGGLGSWRGGGQGHGCQGTVRLLDDSEIIQCYPKGRNASLTVRPISRGDAPASARPRTAAEPASVGSTKISDGSVVGAEERPRTTGGGGERTASWRGETARGGQAVGRRSSRSRGGGRETGHLSARGLSSRGGTGSSGSVLVQLVTGGGIPGIGGLFLLGERTRDTIRCVARRRFKVKG